MELTREQFKMLFSLEEGDDGLEYADELHEEGKSWFEIARDSISTMNFLILNSDK